jgi:hypothetical protein
MGGLATPPQSRGLATPPNSCPNGFRNPSLLSSATSENELGADLTAPFDSSEDGDEASIHIKSKKPSSTEEGTENGVEGDPMAPVEPEATLPDLSFSFDLPEGGCDPSLHIKLKKASPAEDGPVNGEEGDPVESETLEDEDDPMAEVDGAAASNAALEDEDDPMAEVVAIVSKATLEDGDDPMVVVASSEDGGDPSKKLSSTEEGPENGVKEGDPVALVEPEETLEDEEDDPMDAVVLSSKDALSDSKKDGESCPRVDTSSDEDEDGVAVESKKQSHSLEDGKQGGPVLPKEPLPSMCKPGYIQTVKWPPRSRQSPDPINSGDDGDSDSSDTVGDDFTPRRSARLAPKTQPVFNFVPSVKRANRTSRTSRKRKPDLRKDDVSFESSCQTKAYQMVFRHSLRMKSPSSPALRRPRWVLRFLLFNSIVISPDSTIPHSTPRLQGGDLLSKLAPNHIDTCLFKSSRLETLLL